MTPESPSLGKHEQHQVNDYTLHRGENELPLKKTTPHEVKQTIRGTKCRVLKQSGLLPAENSQK